MITLLLTCPHGSITAGVYDDLPTALTVATVALSDTPAVRADILGSDGCAWATNLRVAGFQFGIESEGRAS